MPNESTKWLYEQLTNKGYNVGKNQAEFDNLMSTNSESRKWAYDTAKNAGLNVGKDIDEFTSLVAPQDVAIPEPSAEQQEPEQPTWEPTEQDKIRTTYQINRMLNDFNERSRERVAQAQRVSEPMTAEGRKKRRVIQGQVIGSPKKLPGITPPAVTPASDGVEGDAQQPTTQSGQSPVPYGVKYVDGKPVAQWLLPDGRITTDITEADQAEYGARAVRLREQFEDRMRQNGLNPEKEEDVVEQNINDALSINERKIREIYDRRSREFDESRDTQQRDGESKWDRFVHAFGSTVNSANQNMHPTPRGTQSGISEEHIKEDDVALENLLAENQMLEEARKRLRTSSGLKKSEGWLNGIFDFRNNARNFMAGVKDKLTEADFYGGGIVKAQQADRLISIENKLKNNEQLTDTDLSLVYASMLNGDVNRLAETPHGYNAGQITTEMVPFMIQMAANPASGLSKALVKKFGTNRVKKLLATIAGDVTESAVLANTLQLPSTIGEIKTRYIGNAAKNDDGEIEFDGSHDWTEATAKGQGAKLIENYTEKLGEHFGGIGKFLGKTSTTVAKKAGFGKVVENVGELVSQIKANDWAKAISDIERRAQWNGPIYEVLEEESGIVLNSLFVGDNSLSDLTDKEQQIDIFLGVGLFGGFVSGIKTAGYPIARYKAKKNLHDADKNGQFRFASEWDGIRETIDNADEQQLPNVVISLANEKAQSNEQAKSIAAYASALLKERGYNLAKASKRAEGMTTPEEDAVESSYDNGRELYERFEQGDETAQPEVDATALRMQEAYDVFNDAFGAQSEYYMARMEDPQLTEEQRASAPWELLEDPELTAEKKDAVLYYINAKAALDGVMDASNEAADSKRKEVKQSVNMRTHRTGNVIIPAETVMGKQVYIVSGKVMMNPDGKGVDKTNSDDQFYIFNPETGKYESSAPEFIDSVGEAVNPQDELDTALSVIDHEQMSVFGENAAAPEISENISGSGNDSVILPTDNGNYGDRPEQNNDTASGPNGGDTLRPVVADATGSLAPDRDRSAIRGYEEGLANQHYDGTEYSERDRREAESERLVVIARANGQYFDREKKSSLGVRYPKWTGESEVYISRGNRKIYKVKNPYAKSPLKGNVQPEDAIFEHLVHNKYFPETAYGFEGISDDTGEARIILSQDFVESVGQPTQEQIAKALGAKGLYPEGKYRYGNDEVSVTDVTGDNALLGADGNVYFIDPIIDFKKPVREILGENAVAPAEEAATVPESAETVPDSIENPEIGAENGENFTENVPKAAETVIEPQRSSLSEAAAPITALSRIPVGEEGEPKFEAVDRETAWNGLVEAVGGEADAAEIAMAQVQQASADLETLKKKPPTMKAPKLKGSPMAMAQAKRDAAEKYQAELAQYNQQIADMQGRLDAWNGIIAVHNSRNAELERQQAEERRQQEAAAQAEAVARFEEQQRVKAEKEAEAERLGTHSVHPRIRERWDAAPKVEGNTDAITLPDGSMLTGRYILTEAGAASASHDANNAYQPTEGFPVDENGQSVNDRDYMRDKDAQQLVEGMAGSYDNRALQDPVIVSNDGVVLSGNNRTMSGDLAASRGTDKAYNDYLAQFGHKKYGFTPEQVNGMKNPRVVFVPDDTLPYDATTFARFNAQEKKSQGKPEAAVKLGKIVPDDVFGGIVGEISRYDRLSDYYADEKAVAQALGALMQAGVINDKQLPELRTGTALSASGKELIENTLIGKAFQATPDAVRQVISVPTLRQSVVMGLGEIAHNRTLGKSDYDISEELAKAIDLVARAKASLPDIYVSGMPVSPFGRQQGLFDDEFGDSSVSDATTLILADILNSAKPSDLRKMLATYNNEAVQASNGQMDMFSGAVASKEEILTKVNELFRNATPKEQQALVDTAIAERKRRAEAEQREGNETVEQAQLAPESGAELQQPAAGADNELTPEEQALAARVEVTDNDWTEGEDSNPTYKRDIIIDGTHKVTQVDAPDSEGNYTGTYFEFDGKRFGDIAEVTQHIDNDMRPEPTEAQKAAGNYKMEHRRVDGYNISIENAKGSVRRGKDADGKEWETTMQNDYGYIRGTEGVDGDHIDVFLSDTPEEGDVFVVDQVNEDGSFDEHKVMYGFPSEEAAREAYLSNYEQGWTGLGAITHVSKDEFKKWIQSSRRKTKPFAEYKSVNVNSEIPTRLKYDRTIPTSPEEQRSAISRIIDFAKNIKNRVERAVIGGITNRQEKDFANIGVAVDNTWVHSFESSAVSHNQKHHGNAENEEARGQIAITSEDYGKIPDILEDYDRISKSPNKTKGTENEVIIYEKEFDDGYIYYLEEKRDNRKSLAFHTMYKKKKGTDSSDGFAVNSTAPITPKATPDNLDSNSADKVNTSSADKQGESAESSSQSKASETVTEPYTITATTYTNKKGKTSDVHLVKFNRELTAEEKAALDTFAREPLTEGKKTSRGWYDRKQGGYMMRSEEAAHQLAEMVGNEEAVADAQPMTAEDLREAVGGSGINKPKLPANRASLEDAKTEDQHEISDDEIQSLADELRDLLGIGDDEGDTNIKFRDPGELTPQERQRIQSAGIRLAMGLIERGSTAFPDYAAKMVGMLGDKIRPWLKSFYEGARWTPGYEQYAFTPSEEVAKFDVHNFDKKHADPIAQAAMIVEERKASTASAQAQKELTEIRNEKRRNKQTEVATTTHDEFISNEKKTDVQPRPSAAEREGGHEPQPNEPMGESQRNEIKGTDGRGMGGRSSVNPMSDGERGAGVSRKSKNQPVTEPVPESERKNARNNHTERGVDYAPKGEDARIKANMEAIELAKQLLDAGETATPEQMAILRKFSGWGGLGKAFNEQGYTPNPIAKRLRELLGEQGYQDAVDSRRSAYYTPAEVIDTMWDVARALGFKGGNVLEGSAGIGNILGLMPTDLSDRSSIHAVEIDTTTGGILSLLYPDAKVEIQGFEKTRVQNGSVDLAITNVPFITGAKVFDETGDKDLSKKFHDIHDFCIAKNIRKLREGGIGIFITSSGTMDNSKELRLWITNEGNADVVGAFRMHNKTFGGTGATSDIIVVHKRVNGKPSPNAIDVSDVTGVRVADYDTGDTRKVKGEEMPVIKQLSMDYNKYFVEHPENMAGEMQFNFERGETRYPTSRGLFPVKGKDQTEMLAEWAARFSEIEDEAMSAPEAEDEVSRINEQLGEDIKEGSMVLNSQGELCMARMGEAVPLGLNQNKVKGHTKAECFKAYTAINKALKDVLEYQSNHDSDEGLSPLLQELNRAFDAFTRTYGNLHKNTAISFLRNDVDFSSILALETYSEKGDKNGNKVVNVGKTDIFSRRVIENEKEPQPKTVKDAILASLYKSGGVDVEYISQALGKSAEDVKREIVESGLGFENPSTGAMEVSYKYLSGNVRDKLHIAQANNSEGRYDANIKALESVMPMTIPSHLIEFSLGSSWIEPKLYEDFVFEKTGLRVSLTNVGGTWFMKTPWSTFNEKNRSMAVVSKMCDKTIMGHELIESAITNRQITVSKIEKHSDGTSETITDKAATAECGAKVDEIRAEFKDWAREHIQADPEMAARIERTYNEQFNNYVPMSIPDEFVPQHFGGQVSELHGRPFALRPHQGRAVVRGTTEPILLAHEVGTGKTYTLITTAMEMRRLGTARKPMIVVQNATVGQFVESAKEIYPNAKVLTIEEADRTAEGRKNFYAKIKYNDWDMIVVPQSVFERIPDSEEREMAYIKDIIQEKMKVLEAMREADSDGRSAVVRQAKRELAEQENRLAELTESLQGKKKKRDEKKESTTRQNAEVRAREMLDREVDDVENFDDMGIDALLVDEAHEYKHLGFATAMQRGVKGIDPSFSKKSQGVFLKAQAVMEHNNGRNVVFATGTPISNTAAEIWTFMRYLMPADKMKAYDIYYFDDFVRNFGNIAQMVEFQASGKFKENNRFAGYVNLPELVRIWSSVADTVLTREAGGVSDKIPDMEGGKPQDIYLPQTRALRSVMKYVKAELDRFENMTGKQKKEHSYIPLTMYSIAKAAAVDVRLVVPNAEDDPNSKTNATVRETLQSLRDSEKYKGTVAIFSDNYQNKESGFNLYEDIRKKLIAEGVPSEQIVIIKSGMTVKKKLDIFDKVNAGEIRVIMGSTFTLGTGVNIQERLHTLIHVDAPNRPMDYTQRNGRALRQGNLHKDMGIPVRIIRFGVEDSLDVTAYQRLKTKGAIADSIMNGSKMMQNSMENRVLEEEEDSFGDMTAQLSGSEYAILKNQAEREVRNLTAKQKGHDIDQIYVHNQLPKVESLIKGAEHRIKLETKNLETIGSHFPDGTIKKITIGKLTFDSVAAMEDFFKEQNAKMNEAAENVREGADNYTSTLAVDVDGLKFEVKTTVSRTIDNNGQGKLTFEPERNVTYSCEELGIKDQTIKGNRLKNIMQKIAEDIATGKDNRELLNRGQQQLDHYTEERAQLEQRVGREFPFKGQLAEAKERLAKYEEAMKKELAEKEAKYAELDKTVETASDITLTDEDSADTPTTGDGNKYRIVAERELLDFLDGQPLKKGYRYSQWANMGVLPPMTAKQNGEWRAPMIFSRWEQSEEGMRKENGKADLVQGNGRTTGDVAYNPYFHIRTSPLNDQFTAAYDRPELLVVEGYYPESEETSGYQAEGAKDSVGLMDWHSGSVNGQLSEDTKVQTMLSRYFKPVRIVPWSEVADLIMERVGDQKITFPINAVPPMLRAELAKRGAKFGDISGSVAEADKPMLNDLRDRVNAGEWDAGLEKARAYLDAYESSTEAKAARVQELSERLGVPVRVISDESELSELSDDNKPRYSRREKRAKGWWSAKDNEIVIVLPNNVNVADVDNTFVHEVVGHYGLRKLVGDERFDDFLDEVYGHASISIRKAIDKKTDEMVNAEADRLRVRMAQAHERAGEDVNAHYYADMAQARVEANARREDFRREATEEYMADMAGRIGSEGFEKMDREEQTLWGKIKAKVQEFLDKFLRAMNIPKRITLSDKDLSYILYKSWKNLRRKGVFADAEDAVMRRRTGWDDAMQSGSTKADDASQEENSRFRDGADYVERTPVMARAMYEKQIQTNMYQFTEAMQDSMRGLMEFYRAVESQGGKRDIEDVSSFENAYTAENALSSRNYAEATEYERTVFRPLLDIVAHMSGNEKGREELIDYMMAKHGLERNAYMRNEASANGEETDRDFAGLCGLTGEPDWQDAEAAAQQIVDAYEAAHSSDIAELWDAVNKATKTSLKKVYDCGLLGKQEYEKIRDMYSYYIPLRGFDETTSEDVYGYLTSKGGAFSSPIKTAEGRKSKADDPLATIAHMAQNSIIQGNRNLMKLRFLSYVQNHPSDLASVNQLWLVHDDVSDIWKPVFADIDENMTPDEIEQEVIAFEQRMEALAQAEPDKYKRGKAAINIPYRLVDGNLKEHQIVVKREGRSYVITINGNPRAAQAINGLTNPDNDLNGAIGKVFKMANTVNRQISQFYTTRNPDFVVSNFIRDLLYANTMVHVKESQGYAMRFHLNHAKANPLRLVRLLRLYDNDRLDMRNPTHRMFYEFMHWGGETGYTMQRNLEQEKKLVKEMMKDARRGTLNPKIILHLIGTLLDRLNRGVENSARFAVYVTSRQSGRDVQRSVYDAKEISVNFNKKGSGSKFLDAKGQTTVGKTAGFTSGAGRSLFVFWNAAVQGTSNYAKAFKKHPRRAIITTTALTLLGYVLSALMDDGDDEDKNGYYNIPKYIRRTNLMFKAGEQWITIPLPVEYRALYGLGELAYGVTSGREEYSEMELAKEISAQLSQLMPLDFMEGGGGVNAFVPSFIKPVVESATNTSWTGLPIYKDTPFNKDMPEWTKAYPRTNVQIVNLAKWANEASGGNDYKPGWANINPAQLEYLLNGYFGGYFNVVNKLDKTGETMLGKREYDPSSILLVNRLVKMGDERTADKKMNSDFFKYLEEYKRTHTLLRKYEDEADRGSKKYSIFLDALRHSRDGARHEIMDEYIADYNWLNKAIKDPEITDDERVLYEDDMRKLKREVVSLMKVAHDSAQMNKQRELFEN